MNDLTIQNHETPKTIEEKTKYVLFGAEALNIYRAKLRAMEKAGISKEQYEQLKMEAQETAENLLLFSVDIGKEMQKIEKAKGGASFHESTRDVNVKSKNETIHEMGFTDRQARDFQTLAKHPEVVNKAIEDARAEGRIVTRSDVLMRIAPPKSRDQTMREFKQQAREEHEEFKQAMQDDVVDFSEAKRDKENLEIIALDISMTIARALSSVATIGLIKEKEFDIMVDHMKPQARRDMTNKAQDGIRTLTHLCRLLTERSK